MIPEESGWGKYFKQTNQASTGWYRDVSSGSGFRYRVRYRVRGKGLLLMSGNYI